MVEAKHLFIGLTIRGVNNFDDMEQELRSRFGESQVALMTRLGNLKQSPKENVRDSTDAMSLLSANGHTPKPCVSSKTQQIKCCKFQRYGYCPHGVAWRC